MTDLAVPLARARDGSLVYPEAALPHVAYTCPSCGGVLFRRAGTRIPHYFHKTPPAYCEFRHETAEHYLAKQRVIELVRQGSDIFYLPSRPCYRCGQTTWAQLKTAGTHAVEEYLLGNGRRADIALLSDKEQVRAIIEVFSTHEVDTDKAEALEEYAWMEVDATSILRAVTWVPLQVHFPTPICYECEKSHHFDVLIPLENPDHDTITCPEDNRLCGPEAEGLLTVSATRRCSCCSRFVNITAEGIVCDQQPETPERSEIREVNTAAFPAPSADPHAILGRAGYRQVKDKSGLFYRNRDFLVFYIDMRGSSPDPRFHWMYPFTILPDELENRFPHMVYVEGMRLAYAGLKYVLNRHCDESVAEGLLRNGIQYDTRGTTR